jgi:CRP-like cAMP-binding protein
MSFFSYAKEHERFFTTHGQKVVYAKGRYIVTPLDENSWVFFLKEGTVQASFVLTDGNERFIGYFLPGMTFAKSGSFFASSGGDLEYIAQQQVTLYRVRRDAFLGELNTNQQFNAEYLDMILKNQIFLIEHIVYQGAQNLDMRFLLWLSFVVRYYGEQRDNTCYITISTSQQDIANFLHVTRVSVGKLIKQYSSQGLISTQKKHLTVDMTILKKLL